MPASSRQSTPIDSNQLLSLCQKIRDNLSQLDKSIQLAQLRLTTLDYIQDDIDDRSLKCIDNLTELCNLSQQLIQYLDELQLKMSQCAASPIDYQIASQQLMYFTSEWYENYTPRLNETLDWASRQDIVLQEQSVGPLQQRKGNNAPAPADTSRLHEALLRLKQSMKENERLLVIISSNIDYTRATIDTIYDSLQSTKLGLNAGEQNTTEAIDLQRQSRRYQVFCYILLLLLLIGVTFSVMKLISGLLS